MEIIPVIDVMKKKAVRGIKGEREKYKELKTVFADSSDPFEIARKIPAKKLYCADLDGIMEGKPNLIMIENLAKIKNVMVDAGVRDYKDIENLSNCGVEIVVGTETLEDIEAVKKALGEFGDRILISIDVREGKVVSRYLKKDPREVYEFFKSVDARRFIFLNISRVGTLKGLEFEYLKNLKKGKGIEIYVGGGIRKEDLKTLKKIGVSGALIGTALHQGLIKI